MRISGTGNLLEGNRIGTNAAGTAAIPNQDDGLVIFAATNTIGGTAAGGGNLISGNAYNGVYIALGIGSILFEGNVIGTNAAGTAALANGLEGIESHGPNETLGGTASGAGNLISGNVSDGIYLGTGAGTTLIQGNRVGTNVAGTVAIPNGLEGISAHGIGNTIGGTATGAGNIASGNAQYGIYLASDSGSDLIQGNLIGTNAAGTAALANAIGVELNGTAMTIGGTTAAARNIISGNTGDGVEISGSGGTTNIFQGDSIGTDVTGTIAIPNYDGVEIDTGTSNNFIGAISAGAGNTIAYNTNDGVQVEGTGTTGNAIRGNSIFANGLLGIELGTSGVLRPTFSADRRAGRMMTRIIRSSRSSATLPAPARPLPAT